MKLIAYVEIIFDAIQKFLEGKKNKTQRIINHFEY